MADFNTPRTPPRDYSKDPKEVGARNETHIHTDPNPPREKRSNNNMAYIIGGIVLALVLAFFIFGGLGGNSTAPTSTAPTGQTGTISDDPGTAPTGTSPTGTAPSGDTATDPAPAETAPQQPATDGDAGTTPAPLD